MSLKSGYELSNNPDFRGKILVAIGKVAMNVIEANNQTEIGQRRVRLAREVLKNIHHYAERLYIITASMPSVDTSSTDIQIETAVQNAIIALVD